MLDLEELRLRLRNMTDDELEGYGIVAKIMCSFAVNPNIPPRECFAVQLRKSQAEWATRRGLNPIFEQLCSGKCRAHYTRSFLYHLTRISVFVLCSAPYHQQ